MNAHFEKKLHFENESVFFGKVKVINHFLNSSLIRLFANLLELNVVHITMYHSGSDSRGPTRPPI